MKEQLLKLVQRENYKLQVLRELEGDLKRWINLDEGDINFGSIHFKDKVSKRIEDITAFIRCLYEHPLLVDLKPEEDPLISPELQELWNEVETVKDKI